MITAIAPFNKSKIKVKIAANLFPVLRTFVAPIFPDPILRKFPSPIILDIIIPKGMEPIKYANKITKKIFIKPSSNAGIISYEPLVLKQSFLSLDPALFFHRMEYFLILNSVLFYPK